MRNVMWWKHATDYVSLYKNKLKQKQRKVSHGKSVVPGFRQRNGSSEKKKILFARNSHTLPTTVMLTAINC